MTSSERVYETSDGSRIHVHGRVISWRVISARPTPVSFDFGCHPLGDLAIRFLLHQAEDWASGTLANNATRLLVCLRDYLHPENDLTPETFRRYCKWLQAVKDEHGSARYTPLVGYQHARFIVRFYSSGARSRHGDWSERNGALMAEAARREFRGANNDQYMRGIEGAISNSEYKRLLRAAGIELEECRRILRLRREFQERPIPVDPTPPPPVPAGRSMEERAEYFHRVVDWLSENKIPCDIDRFAERVGMTRLNLASRYKEVAHRIREYAFVSSARPLAAGEKYYPLPDPYVALGVLVGLRGGVRAEEWNMMRTGDSANGYLTVRSDDHEENEADLKIEAATVGAFEIVLEWTEEIRGRATPHLRPLLPIALNYREEVYHVTSTSLGVTRLPTFYQKYFTRLEETPDGPRPLLHREDDPSAPMEGSFAKFRNAAIRSFLDHEQNPAFVQAFARHAHYSTTHRHYSQVHDVDMDERVAMALGPTATMIEIAMQSPVVDVITPDLQARIDRGGATPFGVCGDPAMSGVSDEEDTRIVARCGTKRNCLECDLLYLHVEKLPLLIADRDECLRRASDFEATQQSRDAENMLGAASLRMAHINRINKLMAHQNGAAGRTG